MTQLEKSLEELNKDRNSLGRHMWRDRTQSTFYISKMKDTYSHYISQAWCDIAILEPLGAEMCNFVLLSLFQLPFKGLKKSEHKSLVIFPHEVFVCLFNEGFLNYSSARDRTVTQNVSLTMNKVRVLL